jgi:hypothetical protein
MTVPGKSIAAWLEAAGINKHPFELTAEERRLMVEYFRCHPDRTK